MERGVIFKPMKLQDCKVGMNVRYYPVVKRGIEGYDPIATEITSEPWEASGSIIVKVKGISGGVSIKHLEDSSPELLKPL